jgi:hypothetical protein
MMDKIFHTPLSQTVSGYGNLKPKRKTEAMNASFDQNLANQQKQLFQRAITQFVLLKRQQAQLD